MNSGELAVKVTSGSLEFEGDVTLEMLANMIRAGQLLGVPNDAVITYVSMNYGSPSRINFHWRVNS
jgi:hypothetical protein